MNSLPAAELRRYKEKLQIVGLSCCPYDLPKCSWENDPTKWPGVTYPDIVNYLVDSPGLYIISESTFNTILWGSV